MLHRKPAKKKIKLGVVLGQNLSQIMSNVVKKVKKQAISLGFFLMLLGDIPFKARSTSCKTT